MLFTLMAGEMGDMGGDVALNGGNCHGENAGCGYKLDIRAAVSCGDMRLIGFANRPAYKFVGSAGIAAANEDDDKADALNTS